MQTSCDLQAPGTLQIRRAMNSKNCFCCTSVVRHLLVQSLSSSNQAAERVSKKHCQDLHPCNALPENTAITKGSCCDTRLLAWTAYKLQASSCFMSIGRWWLDHCCGCCCHKRSSTQTSLILSVLTSVALEEPPAPLFSMRKFTSDMTIVHTCQGTMPPLQMPVSQDHLVYDVLLYQTCAVHQLIISYKRLDSELRNACIHCWPQITDLITVAVAIQMSLEGCFCGNILLQSFVNCRIKLQSNMSLSRDFAQKGSNMLLQMIIPNARMQHNQ